jgi:hypothetical protein
MPWIKIQTYVNQERALSQFQLSEFSIQLHAFAATYLVTARGSDTYCRPVEPTGK